MPRTRDATTQLTFSELEKIARVPYAVRECFLKWTPEGYVSDVILSGANARLRLVTQRDRKKVLLFARLPNAILKFHKLGIREIRLDVTGFEGDGVLR